jgi:hypothetical protein
MRGFPEAGQAPSERTELRVLYDDRHLNAVVSRLGHLTGMEDLQPQRAVELVDPSTELAA